MEDDPKFKDAYEAVNTDVKMTATSAGRFIGITPLGSFVHNASVTWPLHNPIYYVMSYKQHFGDATKANVLICESLKRIDQWFYLYMGMAGNMFLSHDKQWWECGVVMPYITISDASHLDLLRQYFDTMLS